MELGPMLLRALAWEEEMLYLESKYAWRRDPPPMPDPEKTAPASTDQSSQFDPTDYGELGSQAASKASASTDHAASKASASTDHAGSKASASTDQAASKASSSTDQAASKASSSAEQTDENWIVAGLTEAEIEAMIE